MSGWTKLSSDIVTSSIWVKDDRTLRVWIAFLALADSVGFVGGTVPGLASLCRMEESEFERILGELTSPDPHSRTPDHEGRRLNAVRGGWIVLNYVQYRELHQSKPGSKAEKQRRFRKRMREQHLLHGKKRVTGGGNALPQKVSRYTEGEEEREAERISSLRSDDTSKQGDGESEGKGAWSREACDDWILRFDGTAPGGPIGRHLKPLVARHGWPAVRLAWRIYLAGAEATYASPARFAATYGEWAGTKRGAVSEVILNRAWDERIELRRRLADQYPRMPGETIQEHIARIERLMKLASKG